MFSIFFTSYYSGFKLAHPLSACLSAFYILSLQDKWTVTKSDSPWWRSFSTCQRTPDSVFLADGSPLFFVDDFFFSFRMHSYREMCRPFCTLSYSHQNLECRLKKPRLQGHYSPALLYQPQQKWVSVLRFHAFSLLIALYKIPLPWEGHCRTKMKAELILADEKVFLQQKKRTFSLRITLHCDPAHNKKLWYAIFSLWVVYCLLCICMAVLSGSLVSGLELQERAVIFDIFF